MPTETVIIEFTADTSGLKTGTKELLELNVANKTLVDSFRATTEEVKKQKGAVAQLNVEVSEQQAQYNRLAKSLKFMSDETKNAAAVMLTNRSPEQLDRMFKSLNITVDDFIETAVTAQGKSKEWNEELKKGGLQLQKYNVEAKAATEESKKLGDQHDDNATKTGLINEESLTFTETLRAMIKEFTNLGVRTKENAARYDELKKKITEGKEALQLQKAELKAAGSDTKGLDAILGAARGVVSGFVAVKSAMALFGEESSQLQETLVKIQLAMTLLNSINEVAQTINKKSAVSQFVLNAAKEAEVAATEAQVAATETQIAVTETAVVATEAKAAAATQEATAVGAAAAATEAKVVATEAEVVATEAGVAATEGSIVAKEAETVATTQGNIIKTIGIGIQRAWNAVMALANPITLAVAVAVTAVAAVYKYFNEKAQEAIDAQKKFNLELEASIDINEQFSKHLDQMAKIRESKLKAQGKTEAEIRKDSLENLKEQAIRAEEELNNIRERGEAAREKLLEAIKKGDVEKVNAFNKTVELYEKIKANATEKSAAFIIAKNNDIADSNKELAEKRKKDLEDAAKLEEKLRKDEQERIKQQIANRKRRQLDLEKDSFEFRNLAAEINKFQAQVEILNEKNTLAFIKGKETIQKQSEEVQFIWAKMIKDNEELWKGTVQSIVINEEEITKSHQKLIEDSFKVDVPKTLAPYKGLLKSQEQLDKDSAAASKALREQNLKDWARGIDEATRAYVEIAIRGINVIGQVFKAETERQLTDIDERKKRVEELRDAGAITEKEAANRTKRLEAEEKKIRTEQAKREKTLALFNAIILGAQAVLRGLASSGIPGAIIAGAFAAAQIALIASKPIPKFRHGKQRGSFEGLGIAGEAGAEIIESYKGERRLVKEGSVVWLNKSDKVYNPEQTKKLLHTVSMNNLDRGIMLSGNRGLNIDYDKLGKAVGENVPQTIWGVKNGEFVETIKNKLSFTTYLNERRK